jgi:hypothetical protein
MRGRVTPSLVLSLVAVVLACTGSAVAGGLITGKQVRDSSLTGKDVKNKSLTPADFMGSVQGPQGVQGVPGVAGPAGLQGPAGIASVATVNSADVYVSSGQVGGAQAYCPAGSAIVGTGFYADIGNIGFAQRFGDFVGIGVLNDTSITIKIHAEAICASGAGVQARAVVRDAGAQQAFEQKLAALRAVHSS